MANNPSIRAERRPVAQLTDNQIQELIGLGKREAEVIDEMESATRRGDRDLAWQLAQTLVQLADEAGEVMPEE
jgi:hypothetical protein